MSWFFLDGIGSSSIQLFYVDFVNRNKYEKATTILPQPTLKNTHTVLNLTGVDDRSSNGKKNKKKLMMDFFFNGTNVVFFFSPRISGSARCEVFHLLEK